MGRGDYILMMDRQRFSNTGLREAHLYKYHQMVLAVIRGEGALGNHMYVGGRMRWPLEPPLVRPQTLGEAEFATLK